MDQGNVSEGGSGQRFGGGRFLREGSMEEARYVVVVGFSLQVNFLILLVLSLGALQIDSDMSWSQISSSTNDVSLLVALQEIVIIL